MESQLVETGNRQVVDLQYTVVCVKGAFPKHPDAVIHL